jgi:TPR repeat protein
VKVRPTVSTHLETEACDIPFRIQAIAPMWRPLAICQKAAEEGLPTAQLGLAQLYAARRASPKDPYMWFLIASEQITRARNNINESMTMEQLLEAEQRAAEWMRKSKKMPPSAIENPPNASRA